jgi:hypothetical protein
MISGKRRVLSIAAIGTLAIPASVVGLTVAGAQGGKQRPAPACKITPIEAMKIATGKLPGTALNANFEYAEGHWVYAVFVVNGKSIKEAEIDPVSGKLLGTENVTPADEAKELESELKVAIGSKSVKSSKEEKDEKDEKSEKTPAKRKPR